MTITANPWIFAILLFGIGCFGVWLLWLMRQPLPKVGPDRTELDSDDPRITRIYQGNRKTEI
jgi:hypothetical protein